MAVKSHRDLKIWQRSMDLAVNIYAVTTKFPENERYGLTSQMRRAAVSVPSNIAEGFYRSTAKDYSNFLAMAKGSLMELETQLILSSRFNYISKDSLDKFEQSVNSLEFMIAALRKKVDA